MVRQASGKHQTGGQASRILLPPVGCGNGPSPEHQMGPGHRTVMRTRQGPHPLEARRDEGNRNTCMISTLRQSSDAYYLIIPESPRDGYCYSANSWGPERLNNLPTHTVASNLSSVSSSLCSALLLKHTVAGGICCLHMSLWNWIIACRGLQSVRVVNLLCFEDTNLNWFMPGDFYRACFTWTARDGHRLRPL